MEIPARKTLIGCKVIDIEERQNELTFYIQNEQGAVFAVNIEGKHSNTILLGAKEDIDEKEAALRGPVQELEELCKPVAGYLKSNLDPHCTVIITDSHIRLVRDEIGIPVKSDELEKKLAALEEPVQAQPAKFVSEDSINGICKDTKPIEKP